MDICIYDVGKFLMKVSDVLTEKDKYILDILTKQIYSYPTEYEIAWKSLQMYFARLSKRIVQ